MPMPTLTSKPLLTGLLAARQTTTPLGRVLRLAALVIAGSLFIAASARISLPLPFSPVPVTGQTLAILLVGALYGARGGSLTVMTYLGEGAMGLPVFAGGAAGPAQLIGPTAGYLWAFPIAAFVVGALAARGPGAFRFVTTFLALVLAESLIFAGGVGWLARFLHVDLARAADLGLWPYLPGDLAKVVLVAIALPSGRATLERVGWGSLGR
jgi:biotin transport system substrate-specific component